ncbi:glutaredoxin family protein [Pseudoalteromonas sp. 10-33]|jgi:hypothetical protein|uniref:glutaredoxin family protein n=1 Tax=Pseudoalteromonas sp. 10-33 TaxID=1761890 RepID=UPI000731F0CB|nr:glutaredoxin family protein [Pseudoalteromonas sp. 10-33]KTF08938.1 thiol-disulfide isomerase [Pseudoalteromonas sp. 10-33]
MAKWTLYHTEGCHLCEQAHSLITPLLTSEESLLLTDIMTDKQLIAKYQVSIPVLENEHGQQLFWPFTAEQVQIFLALAD